jgi:hypothetical protein
MARDREARIRARAHEIWEKEGRPAGEEKRHWEQASREIDKEEVENDSETTAGAEIGSTAEATVRSRRGNKPAKASATPKRGRDKQTS